MTQEFDPEASEYLAVATLLERLSQLAPVEHASALAGLWSGIEPRLLACLRAYERCGAAGSHGAAVMPEVECLRNLTWEVSVSLELGSVRLGALRKMALVFSERVAPPGNRPSRIAASCLPGSVFSIG
jgi:hypothetical protein